MKQVLSVEQMKHLQKIGFDTSDGSMCFEWNECYVFDDIKPYKVFNP